jgi:hypothetical protein
MKQLIIYLVLLCVQAAVTGGTAVAAGNARALAMINQAPMYRRIDGVRGGALPGDEDSAHLHPEIIMIIMMIEIIIGKGNTTICSSKPLNYYLSTS